MFVKGGRAFHWLRASVKCGFWQLISDSFELGDRDTNRRALFCWFLDCQQCLVILKSWRGSDSLACQVGTEWMIWSSITLFLMEILGQKILPLPATGLWYLWWVSMSSLSHRIRTENEDWLPATIVKTDTDGRIIIDLKPDSQGLDFQETSRQGGLVIARCRREREEREREREAAAHKTTQKRSFASYRQGQTHGSPRRRGTPATLKTFGNYQQMLQILPFTFQHQNMAGRTRRKRFEGEKMVINLELRRTRQTCFQMIAQLWQKASNKLHMINLVTFMTHEVQGPGPERDPGRAPQWGLIVCVV